MPRKPFLALAVLTAIALTVAGAAFSRSSATPTLKGVVGPGFTISLKKGGKKVKTLKAGKYKIVNDDLERAVDELEGIVRAELKAAGSMAARDPSPH